MLYHGPEKLEDRIALTGQAVASDLIAESLEWNASLGGAVLQITGPGFHATDVNVRFDWSTDSQQVSPEGSPIHESVLTVSSEQAEILFLPLVDEIDRPRGFEYLVATIDADQQIDEVDESNNSIALRFSSSLVLVTHGWNPAGGTSPWPAQIRDEIVDRLTEFHGGQTDVVTVGASVSRLASDTTLVRPLTWRNLATVQVDVIGNQQIDVVDLHWSGASTLDPWTAAENAALLGEDLGAAIYNAGYQALHLIGHSAGSWLIDRAADEIKRLDGLADTFTYVQLTFLDAFSPEPNELADQLTDLDWAEHYFHDGYLPLTNETLPNAFNVDITAQDPTPESIFNPVNGHAWPWEWYLESTRDPADVAFQGWGLNRSPELNETTSTFAVFPRGGRIEQTVKATTPGDANSDGRFNQLDIVQILQAGKYRTSRPASWHEGDWNGDGFFGQLDLVLALTESRWTV